MVEDISCRKAAMMGQPVDHGKPRRLLVVDDEEPIRTLLGEELTKVGYVVTVAADGEQAIALLESQTFDLIITDCSMPGVGGLGLVAAAKRIDPRCPVIVISGNLSPESKTAMNSHPRIKFVAKPFSLELFRRTVASLL